MQSSPIDDPAAYPGRPIEGPGVLTAEAWEPRPVGNEPGRRPVLAIGSNGSAAQLRRKFGGGNWAVPVSVVELTGIAPAFHACVSRPGYVPWAPIAVAGGRPRRFHLLWLDAEQISELDATEPNYEPVTVRAGRRRARLYRGRWGVIGDREGRAIPAGAQSVALGLLSPVLGREVTHRELAADPRLRETAGRALAALAVDDGLATQ
ncbi:hypothetical protein [Glycomyces salinus]|uniref:hypothetical protein n=1 Tax=Glycomyces salinus TaxID=980294 RepID=UPI0018EDA676|nr:hypothetical protein [Glycomyces salinus]